MTQDDDSPFLLVPARIHEAEGEGRRAFGWFHAQRHPGPVFWVRPAHDRALPLPVGLPPGLAERLHLLSARSETDLLWTVEETLRAAPSGFVLAEPQKPLSLTAGRRLQLAAEAGRTTGLMLVAAGAGSSAAESRWQCAPLPAPPGCGACHRWSLVKNKRGLTGAWLVEWDPAMAAPRLLEAAPG